MWRSTKVFRVLLTVLMTIVLPLSAQAQAQEGAADMTGKTVLITGATDGMGREVALRIGSMGAHVIVHGRNEQRGTEVVEAINSGAGSAEFQAADFGDLAQVRDLAARVNATHEQLHLLINNAGIGWGFAGGERTESVDGYEMIFQVNYLAHFLLTELLLPTIRNSAPARIINVASGAQTPVNFEDIHLRQNFDGYTAYAQSKLAQVLHTFHLADALIEDGITFTTLHPATMMDTTMVEEIGSPAQSSVDEGASALTHLAVSPQLEGWTGVYFNGIEPVRANEQAYDSQALERLDQMSREMVGLD